MYFEHEFYIPYNYDKKEAIIDLRWASSLNWMKQEERAWQMLGAIVQFIVQEGKDPGPQPQTTPDYVQSVVQVHVVYPPVRSYTSNVFQQKQEGKEEGPETSYGCC